jgi:hypothetical protein
MQAFDAYEPCGSCKRHVKRQEASCPFCGAARTPARSTAPRRIRNVSRAQWLAFGSTLLGMGCNGVLGSDTAGKLGADASHDGTATSSAVAPAGDGEGGSDASLAGDALSAEEAGATSEAAPEASDATWGLPDASCQRSGTFACGSNTCDRATQFCNIYIPSASPWSPQCDSLANLPSVPDPGVPDSGTCATCPTCACIPPTSCSTPNTSTGCSCFEDNFGGLTVTCSECGCYGSPPARLERAPLRAVS